MLTDYTTSTWAASPMHCVGWHLALLSSPDRSASVVLWCTCKRGFAPVTLCSSLFILTRFISEQRYSTINIHLIRLLGLKIGSCQTLRDTPWFLIHCFVAAVRPDSHGLRDLSGMPHPSTFWFHSCNTAVYEEPRSIVMAPVRPASSQPFCLRR